MPTHPWKQAAPHGWWGQQGGEASTMSDICPDHTSRGLLGEANKITKVDVKRLSVESTR